MDALVLSGGNIKGAYQAGAISALLRAGFTPGIVTGISVGALNAGYLAGHTPPGSEPEWAALGRDLEDFWRNNVRKPDSFVRKRGFFTLAMNAVFNKWDGLVDTGPLDAFVRREFQAHDPRQTRLTLRVGAVDIKTGALKYVDSAEPSLVDCILASTAEPVSMPLRVVDGDPFYDGGMRDVAPLKQAIDLGAERIVAVVCQSEQVGPLAPGFKLGSPLDLIMRVEDIVKNELVQNDLEWFLEVNRTVRQTPDHPLMQGKRYIPILVVRPEHAIKLSVDDFTPADIERMIAQGKADAARAAGLARADPGLPGYEIAQRLGL